MLKQVETGASGRLIFYNHTHNGELSLKCEICQTTNADLCGLARSIHFTTNPNKVFYHTCTFM